MGLPFRACCALLKVPFAQAWHSREFWHVPAAFSELRHADGRWEAAVVGEVGHLA